MAHFGRDAAQDVGFALRQLRRAPGFAITAVLTIALGIGANSTIFTLVHAVLLRNLPVADPHSLYRVGDGDDCCMLGGYPEDEKYSIFSNRVYEYLRDNSPEFEHLAAMPAAGGNGTRLARREGSRGAAMPSRGTFVSGNYFDLFKLKADRGRLLTVEDDRVGAHPVAVMSYGTWVRVYQSDPGVLGATFLLDSQPFTVVGIAPASFYGDRVQQRIPDFYLPMATERLVHIPSYSRQDDLNWLYLIGRVRPGTDTALLQQKLNARLREVLGTLDSYQSKEGRREISKVHTVLVPANTGIEQMQRETRRGLQTLMGISGLVLLITCANIANLLLARGMARRAETSVRVALGATRRRLLQQMLVESVTLSLIGGTVGIGVAFAGAGYMLSLAFPNAKSLPISANPSSTVLGFTFLLALFTGVLFGIAPAWIASRTPPAEALRGLNRSSRDRSSLPRRALVVLQIAISMVMWTCAGLLTRSLSHLQHQRLGFETDHRVMLNISMSAAGYQVSQLEGMYRRIQKRLHELPGTEEVAFAGYSPLDGDQWGTYIQVEGRPKPGIKDAEGASWDRVSPELFEAVGQRIQKGRGFTENDRSGTPLVAVVNEAFAVKFFPGMDAIGRRFRGDGTNSSYLEFVGVVSDAKYAGIREAVAPMYFRPMMQVDPKAEAGDILEFIGRFAGCVVIHTHAEGSGYESLVRRAIAEVDPNLGVMSVKTFSQQVGGQLNDERMVQRLAMLFGLLALLLASIGLYGVMAYTVAQREPEIGVRMALGADRKTVVTMVVGEAMLQAAAGLTIGIPVSLAAGRLLRMQLFETKSYDPLTMFAGMGAFVLCTLLASSLPARKAARIEPMRALRSE